MALPPMKFKDYVWPHNPRTYQIDYRQDIAVHRVPFGLYVLQSMGRGNRVLRGEGEFSGRDAYRLFQELASVYYDATPGTLVHPLWVTTSAYLVKLEVLQEPTEDYVRYGFEFWETCDGYETAFTVVETAPQGSGTAQAPDAGGEGAGGAGGGSAQAVQEAGQSFHVVKGGESFWSVAFDHGIPFGELVALNPQVRNPNLIYAGDVLRVG